MKNQQQDQIFDQHEAFRVADEFNPLPRSVVRRTPFFLLDGEWKFKLDLYDQGLHEYWQAGYDFTQTAPFPGSIESQLQNARRELAKDHEPHEQIVAWYEREFSIPDEWDRHHDWLTQLTFGACGYETRVWLNGQLLRTIENEEVHFGEYNSFSYELPARLIQATNRLTVRIADSLDAEIPRGKQTSRVYKQGGIWYQTVSGAVRSVWLEPVSRNRLRSRVNVVSSLPSNLVEFDLTLRTHDAGKYRVRITATPENDRTATGARAEFEMLLDAGETVQRFPLEIPNARAWSTHEPCLYHLLAEMIAEDNTTTGIETHFGLREIETRGRFVYLNGEKIYLDGILYQPGTATFEEMQRHFHAMKRLGCNLVRVHIAGIDPRIYDLADQMGMLLWVEVPSPHSSSQRSRQNHWAELQRMLVFIAAHPSVVIWSLYNEDWGAEDIRRNADTRRYIAETYDYMRVNAAQFLVVDNDGWNHVSVKGKLKSDLLTAHVYTPDSAAWQANLDRLVAGATEGVTAQPLIVGDPYFYHGQAPLVISEWGGFGFSDYGGPQDSEEKTNRIREFKTAMRRRPIAGDVYTQATSIESEVNGIIEPHTGELLVPPGLLKSSE